MKVKRKVWLAVGCTAAAVAAAAVVTAFVLIFLALANARRSWSGYQTSISNRILFEGEIGEWYITDATDVILVPGLRAGAGRAVTQVADVPAGLVFVVVDFDAGAGSSRWYAFLDRNSGSVLEFSSLDQIAETVPEAASGLEFIPVGEYIDKHKLRQVR